MIHTPIKFHKSYPIVPIDNIISSDFPKFRPRTWKYLEGEPRMAWLISYEYQKMWLKERDELHTRMYPQEEVKGVDLVKKYVQSLKNSAKPGLVEKEPFRIKKFDKVKNSFTNKRPSDDKAMLFKKQKDLEGKRRADEGASLPTEKSS